MSKTAFHILRVGLAITFLWVGVLIFRSPEGWGSFLQPWAAALLPLPLRTAMIGTAILDIIIGLLFLVDMGVWLGAVVGGVHLIIVLTTTGITDVTVRDIGLLSAVAALFFDTLPSSLKQRLAFWQKESIK